MNKQEWLKQEVEKLGYEVQEISICKESNRLYFEINFNNVILALDFYGKYGALIVETNNKIKSKFSLFGYSMIKTKNHRFKKSEITMGAGTIKQLISIAEQYKNMEE